jgi:hypothetical protein
MKKHFNELFKLICRDGWEFSHKLSKVSTLSFEQGAGIVNMGCRPMLSLREFARDGVLCTFSNIPSSFSSYNRQKLAAGQLLERTGGTVRHGWRYGPPITVQISAPTPLLQPGNTGRRVGSIVYGLRPLWSCIYAVWFIHSFIHLSGHNLSTKTAHHRNI